MKEALAVVRVRVGGFGVGGGNSTLHCSPATTDPVAAALVAPHVKFKVPCEILTTDARRLYNVALLLCYFPPRPAYQRGDTIFPIFLLLLLLHTLHKLLRGTAANKLSPLPIFPFSDFIGSHVSCYFPQSRRRRRTQRK